MTTAAPPRPKPSPGRPRPRPRRPRTQTASTSSYALLAALLVLVSACAAWWVADRFHRLPGLLPSAELEAPAREPR